MTEPERPVGLEETVLDPGRQWLFPSRNQAQLDETVLDPGRQWLFPSRNQAQLDETMLDPGRCRPDGWRPGQWPDQGLPEALATRYELIRPLELSASQGELFLVRVRADGTEAVLKRRHTVRRLDPELADYLRSPDDHLVRHLEVGDGYEVMVLVEGRTLREQLAAELGGLGDLQAIVQQLAAGLTSLHRMGFLHRDVKPANIMIGSSAPAELTLIDFGIAGPVGSTQWPDQPNLAYQPPEWIFLNRAEPASDWWGVGMTVLELASRAHPFEGLPNEAIHRHFALARQVDVSGVPDRRLRNLCQGLLARDPANRWGTDQVGKWLAGEDPELPETVTARSAPVGSDEIAAERPYPFSGTNYYLRRNLAEELAKDWNHSVEQLFTAGGIERLREWLDQFPDEDGAVARGVAAADADADGESGDVRLLRLLWALDPTRAPVYRNHLITRRGLMVLAKQAPKNDGNEAAVLADLWGYRLLPSFDSAVLPDADGGGGQDLTAVAAGWERVYQDWPALVDRVPASAAQEHLRNTVDPLDMLATCLRIALDQQDDLTGTQKQVQHWAASLPVRMAWFDQLAQDPSMILLAELLYPHASAEADRQAGEIRKQQRWRAEAAFREWSRQQNRSAALGWAVAGICLMAAFWFLIVTVSDLVQSASDAAITLAWVGTSVCLPIALTAECLLAVEVGSLFHPRYSMPGAGSTAVRPIARWMQRSRFQAFMTILAVGTGVGMVAVRLPLLLIAGTTAGQLGWVVRRLRAWRVDVQTEDEQVAAADPSRPSATDGNLIEATEGHDS